MRMSLLEHIANSIRRQNSFQNGKRILVAVSGGVDSMVLLHALARLAPEFKWKLFVAHFNHQLRGRASDADENFVRQAAAGLGLPFHSGCGDVKRLAASKGLSIEMAARQLRHRFLAATARQHRCPVVTLAHHADDQVELFFLRLFRGAGGEGIAGMKRMATSPVDASVRLVRPLLDFSKTELEQFARINKIKFRTDASNASHDILRNRLRHELLPQLRKKYQPALNRTLLRLMDLVGEESGLIGELATQWLHQKPSPPKWSQLPVALQRRVIQLQLQKLHIAPDFDLVESLRLQPGKAISVGPKSFVVADNAGRVSWRQPKPADFQLEERRLNLARSKSVSFSGLRLSWNVTPGQGPAKCEKSPDCELFDLNRVGSSIILRHWQPGDCFQPIGMKSAVKLQDWFTNLKIPAARRRELVLASTAHGEIFWVQGLRIGERFKLTEATRKILQWCWTVG